VADPLRILVLLCSKRSDCFEFRECLAAVVIDTPMRRRKTWVLNGRDRDRTRVRSPALGRRGGQFDSDTI
jgi:hypothetical protein